MKYHSKYDVQCKNAYIFNIYAPSTWMDSCFFLFRMLSFTISKNICVCIELFNKWKCHTWDIVHSPTSWTDITLKNSPKKIWVLLMKLGSGIDLFSFLIRFFRYFVFFAKIYENDRLISSYIDDEWTMLQEPNRFLPIIGSTLKDFEMKVYVSLLSK